MKSKGHLIERRSGAPLQERREGRRLRRGAKDINLLFHCGAKRGGSFEERRGVGSLRPWEEKSPLHVAGIGSSSVGGEAATRNDWREKKLNGRGKGRRLIFSKKATQITQGKRGKSRAPHQD